MKKSRFTEEQTVRIVREPDAAGVPATAKKHGISDQTLYIWRKRLWDSSDTRRRARSVLDVFERHVANLGREPVAKHRRSRRRTRAGYGGHT